MTEVAKDPVPALTVEKAHTALRWETHQIKIGGAVVATVNAGRSMAELFALAPRMRDLVLKLQAAKLEDGNELSQEAQEICDLLGRNVEYPPAFLQPPFVVSGTTCDGGEVEQEFDAVTDAQVRAMAIDEENGTSSVEDANGIEVMKI